MRKLTKTAAVVASMAVMAMGATVMTSAATEGWVQSGSNWYYYVKDNKVSNQWVLAGEDWYFLDDEGRMVRNSFVRTDKFSNDSEVLSGKDIHDELGKDDIDDDCDFYYLGNDGKMVTGWKEMAASSIYASPNSGSSTKVWYYFGSTGRMYVNEWVESNGKWYALSPNGQMYAEAVINNDLVDWDDEDYFYMNKDGAMITGWYKTTKNMAGSDVKVDADSDEAFSKIMFMNSDKKWVYGDPVTGVLADEEWKSINNKWYYFGKDARTTRDGVNDDFLNVYMADFELDDLVPGIGYDLDAVSASGAAVRLSIIENKSPKYYNEYDLKNDPNAPAEGKYAMLSEQVIAWANHNSKEEDEKIKYFYLDKDGAALTTWKEIDDDFYICGNNKGELYNDTIAKVEGRYYYFDANGVCDYKYLNNTADYLVVLDGYESGDPLKGSDIFFYETSRKNDSNLGNNAGAYNKVEYEPLNEIKEELGKYYESVTIGTRKVKIASLTESEALLAYAVYNEYERDDDDRNGNAHDVSIYKLRTSSAIEDKSLRLNKK